MGKIIDFKIVGNNCVRFFLGKDNCNDYWGDDWDDRPYEHNAGGVYDKFIVGTRDMYFDIDDKLIEPRCGTLNSVFSKEDMKDRKVPCVIHIPGSKFKYPYEKDWTSFTSWAGADDKDITKFYFGDFLAPGVSYETKDLNMFFPDEG